MLALRLPGLAFALLGLGLGACGDDDDDDGPGRDAGADAAVDLDGASDGAADAGPLACPGDPGPDRIRLETLADGMVGARALAFDGTTAVACGRGFIRAVEIGGPVAGDSVALTGTCRGIAVAGAHVAVTTDGGEVVLLSIAAGAALATSDTVTASSLGGVALSGDVLVVAAGEQGLLRYEVSGDVLVALPPWTSVRDARDVAPAGPGRLAVADGSLGVALVDDASGDEVARIEPPIYDQILVDPDAPGGVRDVLLPFEATTVAVDDDWILAGCGAYGTLRATRVGDTLGAGRRSPTPFGRPPGVEGVVFDVALDGDEPWYADGASLVRMGLSGDAELHWIARELRPGHGTLGGSFWMSLAVEGGEVLALSTTALVRVVREPAAPTPTIDLGRYGVGVRAEPGGEPGTVLLQVGNLGDAELFVRIAGAEPAELGASILELPGQPGGDPRDPLCLRVPAGPSVGALEVRFSPADAAPLEGTLLLETNDPDQPEVRVPVRGNPVGLTVGDDAPDFELPTLDGPLVRSSDLAGDVVLLKFFNFQ